MTPRAGRAGRARWVVLALLAVPALLMLAATVTLGVLVTRSTASLSDNVRLTQNLVDGNVRTLSQAQRELLRLETAVTDPMTSPQELDLRRSLAAQRIQESSLDYQGLTLGSEAMLARARSLAATWSTAVGPRVTAYAQGAPGAATRAEVVAQIGELEVGYNQLVSDAEIARKVQASEANASTEQLVSSTRLLLIVLGVTLLSFLALVAGTVRILLTARRDQMVQADRLKAAHDQLKRHAVAVQTTDNCVLITDADGHIEWVNAAFVRITGYSPEEAQGQVPGQLLQGPDTDPATVAFMRERLRQQMGFACEVLNYTRSGQSYWAALEVTPIRDDTSDGSGPVTGFVAVQSDVTRRRLTEETLVRAKDDAEEMAHAKAQFLASMSHEIRTPLNAVLGLTELLLDTELSHDQHDYVATAHQSGRHLLSLVNDILDFSALDSEMVEIETAPAEARVLLADVITMLQPVAARSGVSLRCVVEDSVPFAVCTDVTRVRQVLINLIGNGLKFTEVGGVDLVASYAPSSADPGRGELTLTVHDTGSGIAPDRQARIFEPFVQGDASTTRTHGGTGLGLAISTRIAYRLGGRLDLDSTEGEGSTFCFTLPVKACTEVAVLAAPSVRADALADITTLRVLLAEDDAVNRMVAVSMLGRMGVVPDIARDGREALDATGTTAYDVVLMDVHMPHVDGVEATRAIRDRGGRQPRIVALTANALDGDRERLLAAGMDDYVSKPFRLDDLRAALGSAPSPVEHAVATDGAANG